MSRILFAHAALSLCVAGCISSPAAAPTADAVSAIASLSPSSGPVGMLVTVRGSGFTATGNRLDFLALDVGSNEKPIEPGVIPDLPSPDGTTIVFQVPSIWRPACSFATPGPCPFARVPIAPGTYGVSVTSSSGKSNSVNFSVVPPGVGAQVR